MDDSSYEELIERLAAAAPTTEIVDLVLAAAEGADALTALLDGGAPPARREVEPAELAVPARVYLTEIAVTGFRGVAERARLPFEPGPGLTLVVGRNGSGKSSFAEGLELLMTGRNLRWDGKPKAWREGWRNLHATGSSAIEATFRADGQADALRVARSWSDGAALDDGGAVSVSGPAATWDELGWGDSLERYRPLLSYNELGAMFSERASELYTALSAVLGLEPFDAVQATLREARLARGRFAKVEKEQRDALTRILAGSEDERATEVAAQVGKRLPDLDRVQAIAVGGAEDEDVAGLAALARLGVPETEELTARFDRLAACSERLRALEATDAERDRRLAQLLEDAREFHDRHGEAGGRCPVCGTSGVLDGAWSERAAAEADALRRASAELREAREAERIARGEVEALFAASAPAVLRASGLEVEPALRAWDEWAAERGAAAAAAVRDALAVARATAARELQARDAQWRPVAEQSVTWVAAARDAIREKELAKRLTAAETWMKECTAQLRSDRLRPVVDAAQSNWTELRHESNVAVGKVELRQSGMQRSVVFDVTVDGAPASAFGVMSQGELSALAISVFLPRASLPESPFGFMVIDDPVQSMDPAKVDGLARVLGRAAESRQVIVFTHDDRLPQAIDRLAIAARVMNVKRRARSKVEVVPGARPSERYLVEAFALCKTDDLPDEIRARVVPGFCRSAIEAACATRIRRRRLAEGDAHADVEATLAGLTGTRTWLAEAFGIPVNRGQEITNEVRRLGGAEAVSVVAQSKAGAHAPLRGVDALALTRGTERLVKSLEAA